MEALWCLHRPKALLVDRMLDHSAGRKFHCVGHGYARYHTFRTVKFCNDMADQVGGYKGARGVVDQDLLMVAAGCNSNPAGVLS